MTKHIQTSYSANGTYIGKWINGKLHVDANVMENFGKAQEEKWRCAMREAAQVVAKKQVQRAVQDLAAARGHLALLQTPGAAQHVELIQTLALRIQELETVANDQALNEVLCVSTQLSTISGLTQRITLY